MTSSCLAKVSLVLAISEFDPKYPGADGAFAPMLKNVTENALQAEMDSHLNNEERPKGNKRNGKGNKKLKSGFGSFDIETPEDRQSSFPVTDQKATDTCR